MNDLIFYKEIINPYFTLIKDSNKYPDVEHFKPYYLSNFCLPSHYLIEKEGFHFDWMGHNLKILLGIEEPNTSTIHNSLDILNKLIYKKFNKSFKVFNVKRFIKLYDNLYDEEILDTLFNYFPIEHWDSHIPQQYILFGHSNITYTLGLYNSSLRKYMTAKLNKKSSKSNITYSLHDENVSHNIFRIIYKCEE